MQPYINHKKKIIYMPDNPNEDIYQALHDFSPIDEYYEKYKKKNHFEKISKFISLFLAKVVFKSWSRFDLGLKIHDKKNLSALKYGGITVCNHVHFIDFALAKYYSGKHQRAYIVTLSDNFRIPFVRKFIAKFGCIPLADKFENKKIFIKRIDEAILKEKAIVHIFPEAALWPYYTDLRPFNDGAAHFSVKYSCPVVPTLITFRKIKGFRRLFRRRPLLDLHILPALFPDETLPIKERIKELNARILSSMQAKLKESGSYSYYKYLNKEEYKKQAK